MILQYEEFVVQVVKRLKDVIPQSPTKVASIEAMENAQSQITAFFNSQEQSKVIVTYSGNEAEGGRNLADFQTTIDVTTQRVCHTIEVHVCTKRFMYKEQGTPDNTMLKLLYVIRAAITGLRIYGRSSGVVQYGDVNYLATDGGFFHLETYMDRNFPGAVAVCRFQIMEVVPESADLKPEKIWGTYQEITLQEYSQQNGATPSISGSPSESVLVNSEGSSEQ